MEDKDLIVLLIDLILLLNFWIKNRNAQNIEIEIEIKIENIWSRIRIMSDLYHVRLTLSVLKMFLY